ncbi:MAG: PTS mannitol transporter subunit IICBA, partial [Oscillospiraceae bacterium]|nr:PTS mannitol transporter subunit IICBA [Oscillospiraceae bacterium]
EAGIDIAVSHSAVNELPQDAEVVFTQESLEERAKQIVPNAHIITVENFLDSTPYDNYILALKAKIDQQK